MTTDTLERDLKTLAEPHADDERLRLAIRATLLEPDRPRRRRRLVLATAGVAAAVIAAATVALVGTGGPSANAAILAHVVRATVPPANLIVHVKETGVESDGTPVSAEWWQETNPPYALRLIKGPADRLTEGATDGSTYSEYDPDTNTVYRQPDSGTPKLVDPVETVRAALAAGTAQVAGTVTIGGRSLYKIELGNGVVGYFDRTDYRPVLIDNPQGDGSVVRTQVLAYEELPLNAANGRLLSVAEQHPDAKVAVGVPPDKPKTSK